MVLGVLEEPGSCWQRQLDAFRGRLWAQILSGPAVPTKASFLGTLGGGTLASFMGLYSLYRDFLGIYGVYKDYNYIYIYI